MNDIATEVRNSDDVEPEAADAPVLTAEGPMEESIDAVTIGLQPLTSRWTGKPSTRFVDTRATLLEALDAIYDGGRNRAIMRQHEEDTLLIAGDISDRQRWFLIVWERYKLQHGNMGGNQERYLVGFINQYGRILHHADCGIAFKYHLGRLHRNRLLHTSIAIRGRASENRVEKQWKVATDLWLKLVKIWDGKKAGWDREPLYAIKDTS